MERRKQLSEEIEKQRKELNKLAELYGLQGKKVIRKSQQLDRLLNLYNHLHNHEAK